MRKNIFLPFVILIACTGFVAGQNTGQDKMQLENERQVIQRELKEIQGLYNNIKGQTKKSLTQLNVLKRKMDLQEQYISNINKELRSIDDDIYLSNLEIYRLQKQLDTLKTQYARTIVYAYKNRSNYDYLNFIFSASSFNDAIKRVSYLKSYRAYREKQVKVIVETQQLIAKRKDQQLGRKDQKNVALVNQTKQVEELAVQKKEKDAVFTKLKSQENNLSGQIAAKKKKDRDLQNSITAIVRREIAAAREAAKKIAEANAKAEAEAKKKAADVAKKTAAPAENKSNTAIEEKTPVETKEEVTATSKRNEPVKKPDSYLDLNANDVALNNKFELNKARLPWPVDNGIVTMGYGSNKIDNTLLTFDNPGITIATPSPGVAVKSVFDGEVVAIHSLGDGGAVTIRHGKYFTTYSNLTNISVSRGTNVSTGQVIGRAGKDDDTNGGQIDFILMIETRNVDPKPWLRR